MFTVIIAEEIIIEKIEKYRLFLSPLLSYGDYAFCPLEAEAEALEQMIPQIYKKIAGHDEWQAIIVNSENINETNPFDYVKHQDVEREKDEHTVDFLKRRRYKRFTSMERAIENPLVKLLYALKGKPFLESKMLTPEINESMESTEVDYLDLIGREDPEYYEFLLENKKRDELFRSINERFSLKARAPRDIILLSLRDSMQGEYLHKEALLYDQRIDYGEFYTYNLYPEGMKYLVFNIVAEDNQDYEYQYLQFLCVLLCLASHKRPQGSLSSDVIYTVACQLDKDCLSSLLTKHTRRLQITYENISRDRKRILDKAQGKAADKDADALMNEQASIYVKFDTDIGTDELKVNDNKIGLAYDCSRNESIYWEEEYSRSTKIFSKVFREPKRAVGRAIDELRKKEWELNQGVFSLTRFQEEDLVYDIAKSEIEMVQAQPYDALNIQVHQKRLEEQNKRVKKVLETRMRRKTTILLSLVTLGLYALGFLPLFFNPLSIPKDKAMISLIITICMCLMGVIGFITLFFLRHKVVSQLKEYNQIIREIINTINVNMKNYSIYFQKTWKFMKGNALLNMKKESFEESVIEAKIMKKHMNDLLAEQNEYTSIFKKLIKADNEGRIIDIEGYSYNFRQLVDYEYPIPFDSEGVRKMKFLDENCVIETVVPYIKEILVSREE